MKEERKLRTIGVSFLKNRFYLIPRSNSVVDNKINLKSGFLFLCFKIWGEYLVKQDDCDGKNINKYYTHE